MSNYKESSDILAQVHLAKKILLSCHHHPDSDSVGSSLSLAQVFRSLGKAVEIVCSDDIPEYLHFLEGVESIRKVRFDSFDFSEYDLFVIADTASWKRLFISDSIHPNIRTIVIDNHSTNSGFGDLNLLDYESSSVCEILVRVFEDWGVEVDQRMALYLFSGIAGDTGSFQYELYPNTFKTADYLISKGADPKIVSYNLFNNKPLELLRFWGLVLNNLKSETDFIYSALPLELYQPYVHIDGTRETAASLFIGKVKGYKFGFILTEEAPNSVSVSLRSEVGFDVSAIAKELGGGGHPSASGIWFQNTSFSEALSKILEVCRKHLQNY